MPAITILQKLITLLHELARHFGHTAAFEDSKPAAVTPHHITHPHPNLPLEGEGDSR